MLSEFTTQQPNIAYGAVKDRVPQSVNNKLPQSVQNFDAKLAMENQDVVKTMENKEWTPLTMSLMGGIWGALGVGCTYLNKTFQKDYDKTHFGFLSKIGDSIGEFLNKGGIFTTIKDNLKNFKTKAIEKSAILRSLTTPTKPVNPMAISQSTGVHGLCVGDIRTVFVENMMKNGGDITKFVPGATSSEHAKEILEKLSSDPKANVQEIKKLAQNLTKYDDVVEFKYFNFPFMKKGIPVPKFLQRKVTSKEMGNKLLATLGSENPNAKTWLGKQLPKWYATSIEGLTNGYAGGKVLMVLQAMMFAQALNKAWHAPKGERLATFTENVANDFSFILAMGLQISAAHRLGGMRYIGIKNMDAMGNLRTALNTKKGQEAAVNTYKKAVKALNEKVNLGTISYAKYIEEADKLKSMLKGDSKWWQKPFKTFGKFISAGLKDEVIMPYTNAKELNNFGGNITAGLKKMLYKINTKGVGTIIRLAFAMFVVGPIISKGVVKASHLIFGKPTNSEFIPDKKKEKNAAAQPNIGITQEELVAKLSTHPKLVQRMQSDQQFQEQILNNPQMLIEMLNTPEQQSQSEIQAKNNIIQNYTNKQSAAYQTSALPLNTSQSQVGQKLNMMSDQVIPNTPQMNMQKTSLSQPQTQQQAQRYIPSSKSEIQGANAQQQQKQGKLDDIMAKADRAEAEAMKYL